jgi:hypothetical protein
MLDYGSCCFLPALDGDLLNKENSLELGGKHEAERKN